MSQKQNYPKAVIFAEQTTNIQLENKFFTFYKPVPHCHFLEARPYPKPAQSISYHRNLSLRTHFILTSPYIQLSDMLLSVVAFK
jgi:hypothetical protein